MLTGAIGYDRMLKAFTYLHAFRPRHFFAKRALSSMELELTTPALLFFNHLAVAAGIHQSLSSARDCHSHVASRVFIQLGPRGQSADQNLRIRVNLIRDMQTLGVASLLCCTVCMGLLFAGAMLIGKIGLRVEFNPDGRFAGDLARRDPDVRGAFGSAATRHGAMTASPVQRLVHRF